RSAGRIPTDSGASPRRRNDPGGARSDGTRSLPAPAVPAVARHDGAGGLRHGPAGPHEPVAVPVPAHPPADPGSRAWTAATLPAPARPHLRTDSAAPPAVRPCRPVPHLLPS